jgi:hypothetical protein
MWGKQQVSYTVTYLGTVTDYSENAQNSEDVNSSEQTKLAENLGTFE